MAAGGKPTQRWLRQNKILGLWLRTGAATRLLVALLGSPLPAFADEFDLLAAIEGAAPLNDQWQACAAAYVKPRILSRQSSATIAESALQRCGVEERRLGRFMVGKIGRKSARNVIDVLRQKYRSDLITVINGRRTQKQS